MGNNDWTRRDFMAAGAASVMLAGHTGRADAARKKRIALVGTGVRATTYWVRDVVENYGDVTEYVGLCDINAGRLEYTLGLMPEPCPVFTDFDEMLATVDADILIVTTVDSTHDEFIVKGLDRAMTVITEKPMTTDETKCQAIIDAAERSTGQLLVGLNYRYGIIFTRLKQLLMERKLGDLTSIDFNWYLNTYHGASYFRRWHGLRDKGGTLLVHKSSHHFDLLNWWIDSDPVEVHAYGALEKYGGNNPFRGKRCMGCPHAGECDFFWDITRNEQMMRLYVDHEHHDGYIRDNCLWRHEIDIFDKHALVIKYANGVQVSYSLTTYSPYEGFRVAFNGKRGRIESWEGIPSMTAVQEDQSQLHAKEMDQHGNVHEELQYHEIITQRNFDEYERELVPYVRAGHWGGDRIMFDEMFRGQVKHPGLNQASGIREGALSVLVGIAARKSIDEGRPVKIKDLTSIQPGA